MFEPEGERIVAAYYGVSVASLLSPLRRGLARPRHVAIFLAHEARLSTAAGIGRRFRRHHTVVIRSARKISRLAQQDADLAETLAELRRRIVAARSGA